MPTTLGRKFDVFNFNPPCPYSAVRVGQKIQEKPETKAKPEKSIQVREAREARCLVSPPTENESDWSEIPASILLCICWCFSGCLLSVSAKELRRH